MDMCGLFQSCSSFQNAHQTSDFRLFEVTWVRCHHGTKVSKIWYMVDWISIDLKGWLRVAIHSHILCLWSSDDKSKVSCCFCIMKVLLLDQQCKVQLPLDLLRNLWPQQFCITFWLWVTLTKYLSFSISRQINVWITLDLWWGHLEKVTTNFALVLINISSRHSNLNFAHHFVIYWLLQNGVNKNQHQESRQRETIHDKFLILENW